jgi:hypothetical protein
LEVTETAWRKGAMARAGGGSPSCNVTSAAIHLLIQDSAMGAACTFLEAVNIRSH